MNYTKGPWTIHKDSQGRGYEINGDGVEVCRINSRRTGAKRGMPIRFIPGKDDEDNARLIAAAPDLLEACKLAVFNETKADDLRHSGMVDNVDITALRAIAAAARAAIAKAEGRT